MVPSYALITVCMFITYWIAVTDAVYLVLLLGMVGTIFGHVLLGIALIRGRFRPRLTGWVLVTEPVTSIALVSISTQALGMWPMMLAWGAAGWSLWRSDARSPTRRGDRATREASRPAGILLRRPPHAR